MSGPLASIVEFADLKARVNTGDSAVAGYTQIKLKYFDPDGDYQVLVGSVEDTTYVAASIDKTKLKRGWWRFGAEAIDLGGKLRKTPFYKKFVLGEGEVVEE